MLSQSYFEYPFYFLDKEVVFLGYPEDISGWSVHTEVDN